ncbi:hypothetical protein ACFL2R_01635 [Patescibacteria group bacterium]
MKKILITLGLISTMISISWANNTANISEFIDTGSMLSFSEKELLQMTRKNGSTAASLDKKIWVTTSPITNRKGVIKKKFKIVVHDTGFYSFQIFTQFLHENFDKIEVVSVLNAETIYDPETMTERYIISGEAFCRKTQP